MYSSKLERYKQKFAFIYTCLEGLWQRNTQHVYLITHLLDISVLEKIHELENANIFLWIAGSLSFEKHHPIPNYLDCICK